MAVPPAYADLGKSARDIFTKGYGFGLIKLDLKTKSENGLEFTSSGSANTETSKVTGSLETKYRWTEYGLTFTEKWNTDNTLGTEITLEDQLAHGLKLTFDSSFSPNTGKKNAKVKSGYKREHINLGCDMDFDIAGPSIRGAFVFGYEGWLAGYQMTFETAKSRVTQSNFAVGYKTDEFQLHTNVTILYEVAVRHSVQTFAVVVDHMKIAVRRYCSYDYGLDFLRNTRQLLLDRTSQTLCLPHPPNYDAMASFKHCVSCNSKLPTSDHHDECIFCLGESHNPTSCKMCRKMTPQALKNRMVKLKVALWEKALQADSPTSALASVAIKKPSSDPPHRGRSREQSKKSSKMDSVSPKGLEKGGKRSSKRKHLETIDEAPSSSKKARSLSPWLSADEEQLEPSRSKSRSGDLRATLMVSRSTPPAGGLSAPTGPSGSKPSSPMVCLDTENDGTEFGGSIYQKVNDKLETAVNLAWTAGNSNTRFGIAARYQLDPDASFSAKVNNSSLIGLGYTQTLKPGIKLTLSALLDGKNVNAGGHKLGLGLEFEA
ncbi:hypothetical protein JD844_012134 [Phrynosoma platyrhinos]|uniref:Non-selective voltage-gated ion channel VDAC1 n=1 Tax=Phrynosoma platyrhinos TaxID=52577 RepID=A0ABQ7TJ20_PHRPL|nr:hypothetical protein JD844_012134 [Phrynosoma platyrhinos]